MICSINVKNFALIDNSEINFSSGFNVLSGETGSGKSIILDAINFALGAKADKSIIRSGAQECFVSAVFSADSSLKQIFDELDLEFGDEIIIKRKFTADGKSSIKVNGETVTVGMLKKITSHLVDVHGQSEHYYLLDVDNQLEMLDKYCGQELALLKGELVEPIGRIKEIKRELNRFSSEQNGELKKDILKYQIDEIDVASVKEGEEEELTELRNKIVNSEKIVSALGEAHSLLESENGGVELVAEAIGRLSKISRYSEELSTLCENGDNIISMLSDLSADIQNQLENLDFSPEQAEQVEKRLDVVREIKRKYGNTVQEINAFRENAQAEYDYIVNGDEIKEKLAKESEELNNKIIGINKKITDCRKKYALVFSEKVTNSLRSLAMQSAVFNIAFNSTDSFSLNGTDTIEFLFSANKGEPLKPMSKVISGGEMSRFMLALKTEISAIHDIPTYIFDEIDAGISGVTAQVVAKNLVQLSLNKQIIAISHQPQICAMSDKSFLIYKYEDESKTYSDITELDDDGKLKEIVRLTGGEMGSEVALLHAKELLNNAKDYKAELNK